GYRARDPRREADRRARSGQRRRGVPDVRAAGGSRTVRGPVVRCVHGRRRAGRAAPRPRPLRDALQRHRRALLLHAPLGLTDTGWPVTRAPRSSAPSPSDFLSALLIERKKPIVLASASSRACRAVSAT